MINVDETTINELVEGHITSPSDNFIFENTSNQTYRLFWGDLVGKFISTHLKAGSNITLTQGGDSSGPYLTISASGGGGGASYTEGDGIDISNDEISVKIGTGLSFDASGSINAVSPTIDSTTKHWIIDGTDTGVTAEGQEGAAGAKGDNGYSISAEVTTVTGGHRVVISSTNPGASDEQFDVMDGVTTIQTTSANSTATLAAANWTGASAPYSQTVTVNGMTASVIPVIGLSVSGTTETGIEQRNQWAYVTRAESGAGSITFYCYENKPTIDLTVNIKAV